MMMLMPCVGPLPGVTGNREEEATGSGRLATRVPYVLRAGAGGVRIAVARRLRGTGILRAGVGLRFGLRAGVGLPKFRVRFAGAVLKYALRPVLQWVVARFEKGRETTGVCSGSPARSRTCGGR